MKGKKKELPRSMFRDRTSTSSVCSFLQCLVCVYVGVVAVG